eukprot:PITA_15945
MDTSRRRALGLKSNQYHLANDTLYRKNYDGVWLRCLEKDDVDRVLKEMHNGPASGHYGGESTAHKTLRAGYYWPTVFEDSHVYAWKCKVCQIATGFGILDALIFDNASYFSSLQMTEFAIDKSICIRYATNYYPQGNGVAESSNKNLVRIIRKSVIDNQRNWHNALTNALSADRVNPKVALGNSPYLLVYG